MIKKYKKSAICLTLVFGSVVGLSINNVNQIQRKNIVLDKFLTEVEIKNDDIDFLNNKDEISPTDAIGEYSLFNNSYTNQEPSEEEKVAVVSNEKIADPSQRYRDVDLYLYVNKETNIYKEDNFESEVIKRAEYADYIHKIGNDPYNSDGFSKIEIDGNDAYIKTELLTEEILFKEKNETIYALEDLKVYDTIDFNKEITTIEKIKSIKMTGESHDIVKVDIDGSLGFIQKSKISKEMVFNNDEKTVWTLSDIELKTSPKEDAKVLQTAYKYDSFKQVGISEEWSKIEISEGVFGYTKTSNLTDVKPISKGEEIVNYALQFIGNPYVWGGTSLTNGTDCSGFTQSVYAHFGYGLTRTTYTQINEGRAVSYENAKPGDLIFYDGHVTIYMGNGQMVHASNSAPYPRGGIKTDAVYSGIIGIRRIVD